MRRWQQPNLSVRSLANTRNVPTYLWRVTRVVQRVPRIHRADPASVVHDVVQRLCLPVCLPNVHCVLRQIPMGGESRTGVERHARRVGAAHGVRSADRNRCRNAGCDHRKSPAHLFATPISQIHNTWRKPPHSPSVDFFHSRHRIQRRCSASQAPPFPTSVALHPLAPTPGTSLQRREVHRTRISVLFEVPTSTHTGAAQLRAYNSSSSKKTATTRLQLHHPMR